MVDRDPTKTAVRKARRQRRLGRNAACAWCGEGALETLRAVNDAALAERVRQTLLERHHPLGRAHDPRLTIILCRNCHARATEGQRRSAVPMEPQNKVLNHAIARLRASGVFHRDAADAEDRMADKLEQFAGFLDTEYPTWSELWKNRK